ncbi:MAG: hypothetical protein A3F72_12415 [Bacteroidetes bacterium RIFCSPLOWO2_12_FULL_35_15]|nr:MAG: hypothetical protein A3F72_12415 [Bacteroidetes bacterium RIFCSPLOWO2_12_FULL_35_15]
MKAFSIVLIVVGFFLVLEGYLFKIMHWPDLFKGIFSGPIIFIVGFILLIFLLNKKNQPNLFL